MRDLPSGTVTFLFTDVEGSTRLSHELRDAYADELDEHRRIARAAFARHGGVEVDTQGDAFFVAFRRASDALSAARDLTQALDGPIRVRVGVHTGEPLVTEEGYVGIDVHRAARIAAAGHGGQVLVSQSTRDLAATDELRDLGRHRLKDLTSPERIYQLGETSFPPLKTLDRVSLPIAATPLVGRQSEVAELTAIVRGGRLVTVTGAGGSGKTRLALQVAAELADDFADGVFFVGLAPVQDPGLVAPTMAQTVGVHALTDLNELALLLVLDNFEHLLPAASTLSELLAHAPHVKLLTTSRTRLHVGGGGRVSARAVSGQRGGRLLHRTCPRRPAGRPRRRGRAGDLPPARRSPAGAGARGFACEGARSAATLERLATRLAVLTGGPRDAPERQQTLRATIEWTFTLLDRKLQVLFRQLSVFAGSFSLETAEQVARAEIDDIAALVDWSLLKSIGNGRFLMLETIREYAHELFEQSAESEAVARAHLDFFLALAEEAERQLVGPDQLDWYERLTVDQDNLRAALELACTTGDGERAQRLAGSLWRFWWNRGQLDEGERWYERAFAAGDAVPSPSRARALLGASHMTEARGDSERTRAFLEEAVETFRSTDDAWRLAIALTHLAGTQPTRGEALRLNQEAIDVAQAAGDARNVSLLKHNLGYLTEEGGNDEQAEALHEESLAGTRAIGDVYGTSATLGDLARLALRRGESRPRGTRLATSSKDHGWRGRSSTLARRSTSRSSGSTPHES